MLPDRVSNPGPLTYESGALPIALRDPAPIYAPALKTYPSFSTNNVIVTCINSCLLPRMIQLSDMGSTLKGKNLLPEEQILSFEI